MGDTVGDRNILDGGISLERIFPDDGNGLAAQRFIGIIIGYNGRDGDIFIITFVTDQLIISGSVIYKVVAVLKLKIRKRPYR